MLPRDPRMPASFPPQGPSLAAKSLGPGPDGRGLQVRADLALLAVAAVWGGTFVMVKDALAVADAFTFMALRFGLAAISTLVVLALSRRVRQRLPNPPDPPGGPRPRALWRAGLVLGLLLFAGYAFQTVGLRFTTPARAAFITGLSVVIVPLVLAVGLRRRVRGIVWAGVALAGGGLALLSLGPDILAGGPVLSFGTVLGDVLVLGCAVAFALHVVALGDYAPRFSAVPLVTLQLLLVFGLSALAAIFERPSASQLLAIFPAAAFTGVFASAGPFLIQTWAQRRTTPTHTALVFSTEPVFGAVFAYLLGGEVLTAAALLGCALILLGMLITQLAE